MREYLIRAGIIGTRSGTNGTFGQLGTDGISGAIDHSQIGEMKSQPREHLNNTWTVRIYICSFIWLSLHCLVFHNLFPPGQ